MDEIAYIYGPYLAHHGIKGQRWGVRRYQNPDGTLTEAGKRRYTGESQKNKARSLIIKTVVTLAAGVTISIGGAYLAKKGTPVVAKILDHFGDKSIDSILSSRNNGMSGIFTKDGIELTIDEAKARGLDRFL